MYLFGEPLQLRLRGFVERVVPGLWRLRCRDVPQRLLRNKLGLLCDLCLSGRSVHIRLWRFLERIMSDMLIRKLQERDGIGLVRVVHELLRGGVRARRGVHGWLDSSALFALLALFGRRMLISAYHR